MYTYARKYLFTRMFNKSSEVVFEFIEKLNIQIYMSHMYISQLQLTITK